MPLLEADEVTGGNVAKIGNALMEQGVIEDDAFDYMDDNPDYKAPFNGVLGRIERIEEIGDRVSNVVSAGLEIRENTTELITSSDELIEAIDDFRTVKTELVAAQVEESRSPNIDRVDLLKTEVSE